MSPNQQHMPALWDFFQSLDPNRAPDRGVDHSNSAPPFPAGFPFGGPTHPPPAPPPGAWPWGGDAEFEGWDSRFHRGPWGHHGGRGGWRRGRHGSRTAEPRQENTHPEKDQDKEMRDSPDTVRAEGPEAPDPAEVTPDESDDQCPPHRGHGRRGGRGGCGRARGGHFRRGGPHHGPGHHHGHGYPPPPYPGFDLNGLMRACHPFVQNLRDYIARPDDGNGDDVECFTPPVDTFNTPTSYVLHVALPGAKKEDVGVNWDPDSHTLNIAGVVHRPGDEEFLQALENGERKVGMFERKVALPSGDGDEVDGLAITAKMEDGVLIVTVPKAEKEWTEIHKVDIE